MGKAREKNKNVRSKKTVHSLRFTVHSLQMFNKNFKTKISLFALLFLSLIIVILFLNNEKNIFGRAGEQSTLQRGTIQVPIPLYGDNQDTGIDFSEGNTNIESADLKFRVVPVYDDFGNIFTIRYEMIADNGMIAKVEVPSIESILEAPSSEDAGYASMYPYDPYSGDAVYVLQTREGNWVRFKSWRAYPSDTFYITYDYLSSNTGIFDEPILIEKWRRV